LQVGIEVIKRGMAENQLQRFQIMPLLKQSGCHRSPTGMATAALDARFPVQFVTWACKASQAA